MIRTSNFFAAIVLCCLLILGATAQAGVLAGNASAYNDGNGPLAGSWTGTSPFASDGLHGHVDWAVFTASDFNAQFGGGGYTAPAGELVYAYQIFTNGPVVGATGLTIFLDGHPAGNGGSFSSGGVSGVPAVSAYADPFIADFLLAEETDPFTPSEGLVYSSPNRPQLTGVGVVIDGGQSAEVLLPIPGPIAIPEPTTWLIGSMGLVLLSMLRRGRRG